MSYISYDFLLLFNILFNPMLHLWSMVAKFSSTFLSYILIYPRQIHLGLKKTIQHFNLPPSHFCDWHYSTFNLFYLCDVFSFLSLLNYCIVSTNLVHSFSSFEHQKGVDGTSMTTKENTLKATNCNCVLNKNSGNRLLAKNVFVIYPKNNVQRCYN